MNRTTIIGPLLASLVFLSGCADTPQKLIGRAAKAYAAHDYHGAQLDLTNVLDAEPSNVAALDMASRVHLAQGDGLSAQTALDKLTKLGRKPSDFSLLSAEAALLRGNGRLAFALASAGQSGEAYRIRALAQLMLGNVLAAEQNFGLGFKASGDQGRLLADYSVFELGRGNLDYATQLSIRALQAAPGTLDPLLAAAKVAVARGDLASALRSYSGAARSYPGNLAAMVGKAAVLGDLGRQKEFADQITVLSATAGGSPAVAYLQARAATSRKDWRQVRTILQPFEADIASHDEAMLLYAQALLRLGESSQARARLTPLYRRAPGHVLTVRLLAEAQLAGNDAKAAEDTLRPLADKPEASSAILALMTKAAKAAGDTRANQYADRARFPTPQSLGSELALGDTALRRSDWRAASQAYERILAVTDGKNAMVLNNLAYAQSRMGNSDRALTFSRRALAAAPHDPSVMDTYGWLIIQSGHDRDHGIQLLQAAAHAAPTNDTIRMHLASAMKG